MLQLHGDEGPAFCDGGRAAHRLPRDQGRARRTAPPTSGRWARSTPTTTCSTPSSTGCAAAPASRSTGRWRAGISATTPLIVGGGLTADNVGEAIAATAPFAVDVASGVEAEPGIKDPDRMRAFVRAVAATSRGGR